MNDAWQTKLQTIALQLQQRQRRPQSPPILKRRRSWPVTPTKKRLHPLSTGKSARSLAGSKSLLEKTALLLNRLAPGHSLGTRLLWQPWHRAKHRVIAWSLLKLTTVFASALPLPSLAAPMRGQSASSNAKPKQRALRVTPLISFVGRLVCRWLIKSCS